MRRASGGTNMARNARSPRSPSIPNPMIRLRLASSRTWHSDCLYAVLYTSGSGALAATLFELNDEQRRGAVRPSVTVERFLAQPQHLLGTPVWIARVDDATLRARAATLD